MRRGRPITDEQLLTQAANDPEAFGAFYDRHAAQLIGALRRRTGSIEIAFDVGAEVFAAALESCAAFDDRRPGSAAAWLYGIARHKLADLYRSATADDRVRRRLGMQPIELTDSGLDELERQLDTQHSAITLAVQRLPPDERDAIEAHIVAERGYAEIAADLDVSQSVVRQRVHRGLERLRATTKEKP